MFRGLKIRSSRNWPNGFLETFSISFAQSTDKVNSTTAVLQTNATEPSHYKGWSDPKQPYLRHGDRRLPEAHDLAACVVMHGRVALGVNGKYAIRVGGVTTGSNAPVGKYDG